MNEEQIKKFLLDHLGIRVSDKALARILNNPEFVRLFSESFNNTNSEIIVTSSRTEGDYSYRDDYYKNHIKTEKADSIYGVRGRPHFDDLMRVLGKIKNQDPRFTIDLTNGNVSIDYSTKRNLK